MKDKDVLLISFSGGRTSGFMAKWIIDNLSHKYEIVTVFSNTGKERPETLDFVKRCDEYFNLNTIWIEAQIQEEFGKGILAKVVNYETADREGAVFRNHIKKYGLSNVTAPMCTRDLKTSVIRAYMRQSGYKNYYTAIGIRADEFDRMNPNHKKERIIYPLISLVPTTKQDINKFWSEQPFDLELKSYEGNCDCCFKKSLRKLLTIAKENPQLFEWWENVEKDFENYIPETRDKSKVQFPLRVFRNNLSAKDILEMSKTFVDVARDDSKDINQYEQLSLFGLFDLDISNGCSESCEAF